jgi:hypothetical protein
MNDGRPWLAWNSRPTYSPSRPRQISWTAPIRPTASTVDVQPGTLRPASLTTSAASTIRPDIRPPSTPSQVASRNGAAEKAVTLSNASRTILLSEYLVEPAARSART